MNKDLPKRIWKEEDLSKEEKKIYKDNFSQISGKEFDKVVQAKFVPFVRSHGFKGSKNKFYKIEGRLIYAVSLLKSRWGGMCILKLGAHFKSLEDFWGFPLETSKYSAANCIASINIFPTYSDISFSQEEKNKWYLYGLNKKECEETVDILINTFEQGAFSFFNKFKDYPIPFDKVSYEDMQSLSNRFIEYGVASSHLRYSNLWAKIKYMIGQKDLALQIVRDIKGDQNLFYEKASDLEEVINQLNKPYRMS